MRDRIRGREGYVELSVISIEMVGNRGIGKKVSEWSSVETKEKRTKNRTLGNTSRDGGRGGRVRLNRNRLGAIGEIRRNEGEGRTGDTKVGSKA